MSVGLLPSQAAWKGTGTLQQQQSKPLLHPWVPLCFLWLHLEVQGVCLSQVDAQVRVTFHMALMWEKKRNSCSQRAKISFSLKAWKGKQEIKTYVGHSNPLKMKTLIQNAEDELSFPISRPKKKKKKKKQ